MADSAILNEGLKYAINRETPSQGDGTGRFWPHGTRTWPDGQSMPSGHSITAWSFAHVVADRYPGWKGQMFIGNLRGQALLRIKLDGHRVVEQQRLVTGLLERIRDVRQGPDGWLYLLTNSPQGRVIRVER